MADREQVQGIFRTIAARYDRMNTRLSLGRDASWRQVVVAELSARLKSPQPRILDLACGTCATTIDLARALPEAQIEGLDYSPQMLEVGRAKLQDAGLQARVPLTQGAAEHLPFEDGRFDAITCTFGARNFTDLNKALHECRRVLRPGGILLIAEFQLPSHWFKRLLFLTYAYTALPLKGWIYANAFREYLYLPRSISAFSRGHFLPNGIASSGFHHTDKRALNLGSVGITLAW